MERVEQIIGILSGIILIVGIVFYIATHLDCGKIPLLNSVVCVATK